LNREFALIFNPQSEHPRFIIDGGRERKQFAVGDKVMATKNDWEIGITNGMTGVITEITTNGGYSGDHRLFGPVDEVNKYLNETGEEDDHVDFTLEELDESFELIDEGQKAKKESRERGHEIKILDIGGGFPAPYNKHVKPFPELARVINAEIDRLFAPNIQIVAEPGRFLVATAATSVARVIGKAVRNGKRCYYIDDSVYHTFSGIIFDHCQYPLKAFKSGKKELCAVFGQTCDGLDCISQSDLLPDLEIEELVYAENIGAYGSASATYFNGFPPAKVIHVNV
jgi:hypothetical protein